MAPDIPAWFLGVLAVVVAIPAGRWTMRAIGKQIAADILAALTPGIQSVARAEVELVIDEKLQPLYDQLEPNGGASMHDRLTVIEELLHTWEINQAAEAEGRWDPPSGAPA